MNQSQLYSYAKGAGLSDDRAKVAAAIAMAESGGNPSAMVNDSDDLSYGLWQINMKGTMGPSRRALYGLSKNEDLLDPSTNARVMSEISHQGQSFAAWTTYTGGKYKQFLGATVTPVSLPNPASVATGLGAFLQGAIPGVNTSLDVLDTVTKVGGAVTNTARWVSNPKNWLRVAYVIGGGVLIYAGIQSLILPTATNVVGKVAGFVGPGGKVSKIANATKKVAS